MLNVTVGTNTNRKTIMVPEDYTVRQCLEEGGVSYSNGQTSLNSNVLNSGSLDNTIGDMVAKYEITGKVFLTTCIKQDNAVVM